MYLYFVLFFILGLIFSMFLNNIWYRLPLKKNIFKKSSCDSCDHELKMIEKLPIISYFKQNGKCNYCHQKISPMYLIFELLMGISFLIIYIKHIDATINYFDILLSIIFISSLLVIMFSDIKYMLIPNELLIVSTILVIVFRLLSGFHSEELNSFMDAGYLVLFMIFDAVIMFVIMYVIKKVGDMIFKKESLGGGDIKMMAFIALIMGYKMSIIVIFIGSFIALPFSIYNAYKKNEVMLPFGPYLAISTIILYLFNINFDMVLELIN